MKKLSLVLAAFVFASCSGSSIEASQNPAAPAKAEGGCCVEKAGGCCAEHAAPSAEKAGEKKPGECCAEGACCSEAKKPAGDGKQ